MKISVLCASALLLFAACGVNEPSPETVPKTFIEEAMAFCPVRDPKPELFIERCATLTALDGRVVDVYGVVSEPEGLILGTPVSATSQEIRFVETEEILLVLGDGLSVSAKSQF